MQAISMFQQQNLVNESFEEFQPRSTPIISKIESESLKFKTLVSHLRMNKKHSNEQIQFCNDSEISNIQHKSDKCSFDLQIPTDTTAKKPFSLKTSKINLTSKDQGDLTLKYKPRSNINGRDDIRIRNINQVHKQLIDSLNKRRNNEEAEDQKNIFEAALNRLEHKDNHQSVINRKNLYTPDQAQIKQYNRRDNEVRKFSHTQQLRKYSNDSRIRNRTRNNSRSKIDQGHVNPEEFVDQIDPKSLIAYLKNLKHGFPTSDSTPNQIYSFFINICTYFGFKQYFKEPLIKRYQNCIYFGQKIKKQTISSYNGFIWYYRQVLYYGQFNNGKKNGYGIEVDIEEQENECIWRGTFLNGKKTGYFNMMSPQMEYNGSVKNSYFDGQGHLKTKKSTYQGSFQAGMKHGTGVQNFHVKTLTYRGQYADNKFEGNGQIEGPNYFYKGEFRGGKQHGSGFERTKEYQYVGQFKNGKRNGRGVLKMNNGEIIQGTFKNGELIYEEEQTEEPQSYSNQYTKSIPIQSPRKNLPHLIPMKSVLPVEQKLSIYDRPTQRNSKVVLDKHLSKQLHALYEENEEGTIEHDKYNKNRYQKMEINQNESDQEQPLELKVLPTHH